MLPIFLPHTYTFMTAYHMEQNEIVMDLTKHIIQIYSGNTSGRVLDGIQRYKDTKILEVNLFAFAYRLFHEDFSSINGALQREIFMKQSVGKCKKIDL